MLLDDASSISATYFLTHEALYAYKNIVENDNSVEYIFLDSTGLEKTRAPP